MTELKKIKIVSLSLFTLLLLGILSTLIVSNILVTYKISFYNYPFKSTNTEPVICNIKNNFCKDIEVLFKSRSKKIEDCRKETYQIDLYYPPKCDDCKAKIVPAKEFFDTYFTNNKFVGNVDDIIYLRFNIGGGKNNWRKWPNSACILNSKIHKYYLYFPSFFNWFTNIVDNLKKNKNTILGHSEGIMPYLYGESSISNIAKRFPINYIFKTFMFFGSLMIFVYWKLYNKIINKIKKKNKINLFYITGILSSILLFLHVLFLGSNIEILYLKKIKTLILILFIFFEIFAQSNLVFNLYINKEKIKYNINGFYLELKKYLIILILITFVVGMGVFIFADTGSKFNNIVEWNFFTLLIFFYLFSYFMWNTKKEYFFIK